MTSAKRIRANRRNARRSTGPRSEAGKQRSSMNALKHGLDAQTVVLPGEDESAYQSRLEAWTADCPPRDVLEQALLEQATRLSWQLDRADRVQAAQLTERIQLAATAETPPGVDAEVEELGKRLSAGQPAPVFDRAEVNALIDGKRLGMPYRPDDPNHPARLLRRLESSAAGCEWLLRRWRELRAALEANSSWQPLERITAVRLLAKQPADAPDDWTVQSIYLYCFVLDGNDPRVFDDQAEEMTRREFNHFIERMAGRGLKDLVPPSRELALVRLLAVVDGIIMGLEARAEGHTARARAAAATAASRLGFDDSPQGERLRRLQGRLLRSFIRTMGELTTLQRRPKALFSRTESAENVVASPAESTCCANVRNEANERPEPTSENVVSEGGSETVPAAPVQPADPQEPVQPEVSAGPGSASPVLETDILDLSTRKPLSSPCLTNVPEPATLNSC
jgi:hypothetical protein